MKFTDIAIVTDIDGTFFDSHSKVVQRNLEAVEYFKENGGLFAVATGRVPEIMGPELEKLMPTLANIPCISCNGAFAYDFREKRAYNEIFLNADRATELIKKVIAEFPAVTARLSTKDGKYVMQKTNWDEPSATDSTVVGYLPIDDVPRCGWYRAAFDGSCSDLDTIRERFEQDYTNDFDFVKSCDEIYEFNDKTATKGNALNNLRKLLIDSGRASSKLKIYSAGDFENDLTMLRSADVACCPANAIQKVKDICKLQVCKCDDGAIADIIEAIDSGKI